MPVPPALQPKPFEGKPGENCEPWLNNLFRMMDCVYGQSKEQVTASFVYFLTSHAEAWYNSLPEEMKQNPVAVLDAFKKRFDGKDLYTFKQIVQAPSESVSDFTTRFVKMATNHDFPEKYLITSYVDGLQTSLKKIVQPQDLRSFEDARRAAIRAECVEIDFAEISAVTSTRDSEIQTLTEQLQNLAQLVTEISQHQSTASTPEQPQQPQTYQRQRKQRKHKKRKQQPLHGNQGRNDSFCPISMCILCRVAHNNETDCPYFENLPDIVAEFGPQRSR